MLIFSDFRERNESVRQAFVDRPVRMCVTVVGFLIGDTRDVGNTIKSHTQKKKWR